MRDRREALKAAKKDRPELDQICNLIIFSASFIIISFSEKQDFMIRDFFRLFLFDALETETEWRKIIRVLHLPKVRPLSTFPIFCWDWMRTNVRFFVEQQSINEVTGCLAKVIDDWEKIRSRLVAISSGISQSYKRNFVFKSLN